MINVEVNNISTSHDKSLNSVRNVIVVMGKVYADFKIEDGSVVNISTKFQLTYVDSPNGKLAYTDSKINKEIGPEENKALALFIKDAVMKHVRNYAMNDYRKMIYEFFDKYKVGSK